MPHLRFDISDALGAALRSAWAVRGVAHFSAILKKAFV